jgi:hypothetical protein
LLILLLYRSPVTYDVSLTEISSAGDAYYGLGNFGMGLYSASGATDFWTALANFVATVDEDSAAIDGPTASVNFVAIVDEGITSIDAADATISFPLHGVECIAQVSSPQFEWSIVTGVSATAEVGSFQDEHAMYLVGVEATTEFRALPPEEIVSLGGVECTAQVTATAYGVGQYGMGTYSASALRAEVSVPLIGVSAASNSATLSIEELLPLLGVQAQAEFSGFSRPISLTGVSATAQVGTVSNTGTPGPRTFFIASTTQKVIAPGMQMYPTSDTINMGPTPYIIGSSQFYTIGQVIWNGTVKVEGVDWEFVRPFTHIIKILNPPSLGAYGDGLFGRGNYSAGQVVGTPITLVYVKWNIQVTQGFTVTSYPVPFAFSNTTIVADAIPPIGQYFTVRFVGNRIVNNPQTLFSIFPVMVDDMLADHTAYDEPNGFQTYRPECYQVLDTTVMQIFEWTGSAWVAVQEVSSGTSFYVKSLRQVWKNQMGTAVLKYTAGDGPSGSYPQAITYPAFGEGIGKNLLVDGFSADAPTQYPAAYQVISSPGTYDSVCRDDEGFDRGFDFSFS